MTTNPQTTQPLQTKDAINKMTPFIGLDLENIHLVTTLQEMALARADLLGNPFVGFDTESRPTFRKGEVSEGPHVLQFATPNCAYIFQTHNDFCRPVLAEVLESKQIIKIGFGLNDDMKRITDKLHLHSQEIIDLDHIFKRNFGLHNSVGVKTAIALLFNQRFLKSRKATTSNWSNRELSEKQLIYAANDAFAAIAVYIELKKRGIS